MSGRGGLVAVLVLALAGCALEASPSVPGAPDRRAVVVPTRSSCEASCPAARDDEELDTCHPIQLTARVEHHRRALGETPTEWVVCYFEER
jgi:hypothetical protein